MRAPRRTYHTHIKVAVYTGLLPDSIARLIPKSTLSEMRRRDPSYHFGSEYAKVIEEMDLLKEIAGCRAALRIATVVLRLAHLVRSIKLPFHRIAKVKDLEVRRRIVAVVDRLAAHLPVGRILKLLGLTRSRFTAWSRNLFACISSPRSLCRRVYPNQLVPKEVAAIRGAFSNPTHFPWPAISVAWDLIHSGKVSAHVQTIVRYAGLLGLTTLRHPPHKCRKRGSIVASRPNEVWHLDVTIVRALDNAKAYVQLLQDNFSRKIIAWRIARSVSGLSTAELLYSGYASLTQIEVEEILLIVDGGPENNNGEVEALLERIPLKKLIAEVHITCSNSMIEAVNKILKYRYLFRKPIPDVDHLESTVAAAIADYNDRPHGALCGLTPNQVYAGARFHKAADHERIQRAVLQRRLINSRSCPPCAPLSTEEGASREKEPDLS